MTGRLRGATARKGDRRIGQFPAAQGQFDEPGAESREEPLGTPPAVGLMGGTVAGPAGCSIGSPDHHDTLATVRRMRSNASWRRLTKVTADPAASW